MAREMMRISRDEFRKEYPDVESDMDKMQPISEEEAKKIYFKMLQMAAQDIHNAFENMIISECVVHISPEDHKKYFRPDNNNNNKCQSTKPKK